jgi:S1-C subfamily serine protease
MTTPLDTPIANPLHACSEALADLVANIGRATLAVRGPGRHGVASGVIWRPGILVTAAHVFRRAPAAISVVGAEGAGADAALIGLDSPTDVAVFRLADAEAPAAPLAGDAKLRAGELAIAVGRSQRGELTSSFGMVNRVAGAWQTWLGGHVEQLIRLDGGIHDGLSGGPVANAGGKVLGIATSALSRGYGVVVPEATVSRVVDDLLLKGHVARAFLGIGAQPVPVDGGGAEADSGLLITSLVPAGPAAQAGVLIGDIVLAVGGHPATSLHDMRRLLAAQIGQSVPLALIRGGVPIELALTVAQWPTESRRC